MNFTKKFDRAFQWAGEKMGNEARTGTTDEFKMLEMEMALRFDGMVKLQTTMNAYVKWLAHRDSLLGEKGVPTAVLSRTMITHGEDFDPDSQFGNCLIEMGRANDQVAHFQEQYANDATRYWLDSLERSVAMMKEYQAARKKLESRRLALDASTTKMQKARRDDFRLEEELRSAKAKYEETNEDVLRRMQDIKDAEADSIRDLTRFLDVELDYHDRCAEALRQTRATWTAAAPSPTDPYARSGSERDYGSMRRPSARSRSNTAQSFGRVNSRTDYGEYDEPDAVPAHPARAPIRSQSRISVNSAASGQEPVPLPRPGISRASTYQSERSLGASLSRTSTASTPLSIAPPPQPSISSLRGQLRPTARTSAMDVFAATDDEDTTSSGTPPGSTSPATSYGSSSRTNLNNFNNANVTPVGVKKAPPPPPSRAKKPAPPVPIRRQAE
ncbi:BAR-domain-containing protein [Cryphonectria parasitica EP155]|uniref:BAR-domain-containing protein n=1 Tax=Cryphonectria parasitica (strain ATCC 38755 / EP155) TaxID=660469 RepID=A0A9P5CK37_CRYP1|nr:BAR-domain-containing protein [Cryphonectria parasitica EP155]KAF3760340.1 BAR-domain-containing protein [Cryphonectria parasitica EP155]